MGSWIRSYIYIGHRTLIQPFEPVLAAWSSSWKPLAHVRSPKASMSTQAPSESPVRWTNCIALLYRALRFRVWGLRVILTKPLKPKIKPFWIVTRLGVVKTQLRIRAASGGSFRGKESEFTNLEACFEAC